jgi:methylthioribose-1-phosphate isomerase
MTERRAPTAEPLPAAVAWAGGPDGELRVLDQTLLPHAVRVLSLRTLVEVADVIQRLAVRGAPAIGVAGAYGLWLGVRGTPPAALPAAVRTAAAALLATRPTAVNLRWALERMTAVASAIAARQGRSAELLQEAQAIAAEDAASCARIGECGAGLVGEGATVLTHCNTGRLATCGDGTALAVLYAAFRQGRRFRVLAGETRPLLQGARLTALELAAAGIPVELIVDGAAAGLIARGAVDVALVGADRIAANGDFANKVGTYGIALACAAHRVPFYAVAPRSTFDATLATGAGIPIEERSAAEVLELGGVPTAARGIPARNPAFDVTPAHLLTGIVTDHGLLRPPFADSIKRALAAGR